MMQIENFYNIDKINQMIRHQSYVSRSSISSNNQPYKIPSSVRSTFLNRDNSNAEPDDFNINSIIRRSAFMTVTCRLCNNKFQREQMIALNSCNHIFCTSCMHQYIIYKLNVMEDVACPEEDCNKQLDPNSICFTNLSQEYKNKYKKLQVWKQTINNPNLRLCPAQKCNGIIDIANQVFACQQCKIVYCSECMLNKHEGPCDKNFQLNFLNWKRCPECRIFIEKTEGCNHMTCRCNHQFCYVCLSNWDQQHYECGQVQNQATWVIDTAIIEQMSTCKRILIVILMIILFPLVLCLGIALLVIIEACAIALGLLCGGCAFGNNFFKQSCCCCLGVVICFPVITVVAMVFAAVKVFTQLFPIGIAILVAYFKNMFNIFPCNSHQQDPSINQMQFQ